MWNGFFYRGSFELGASIAGHMHSTVTLAVHGVFMNTCGLFYNVPWAVASATATIAGNLLGANKAKEAWGVIKMGIIFDFNYGVVAGLFLYSLRSTWGALYTSDTEVQHFVEKNMIIMFVYIIVDSTKCITLNVLRSIGLPTVTVVVNSVSCLVVMLPFGVLFGIKLGYGLIGLWGAMSAAWLVATLIFGTVIARTDWEEQAQVARQRNLLAKQGVVNNTDDPEHKVELKKEQNYRIVQKETSEIEIIPIASAIALSITENI